jgi:hypothetical protein
VDALFFLSFDCLDSIPVKRKTAIKVLIRIGDCWGKPARAESSVLPVLNRQSILDSSQRPS